MHDARMRRWNGWGDETETARLGDGARAFLANRLGPGTAPRDATLAEVVAAVPASRLDDRAATDPGLSLDLDPEARVRHARGQSLPDLIALRSGRLDAVPDAVVRPASGGALRAVIDLARERGARLIPYGGGTSVVGGVSVRPAPDPVISVDLARLAGVTALDERSGLVTCGAGTTGPALAAHLAPFGLTVGHEPQSFELATVGGWVAARGSGLRSFGTGRIEQLYAGGRLEAPAGTMDLPPFPASAAGPDLRQLVLGSEGRLGFLTDVILRTSPLPEVDRLESWALPGWEPAVEAAREIARQRIPLAILRLSTPAETATLLAFADRGRQIAALRTLLRLKRQPRRWALLLTGAAGRKRIANAARDEAAAIIRSHGGTGVPGIASAWSRTRFRSPYLRTTLWTQGYASDTLETATDWARVPGLLARLEAAIANALLPATGERVHVFTHLSHLYPTGSSLYLTFIFRLAADPDATLERWQTIKAAASTVIAAEGATITHHHGVGRDHAAYLAAEKGPLGMAALEGAVRTFDPDGMMNPGVLLAERGR
jgi:alkyldihydroxyacetonephosphate synthase